MKQEDEIIIDTPEPGPSVRRRGRPRKKTNPPRVPHTVPIQRPIIVPAAAGGGQIAPDFVQIEADVRQIAADVRQIAAGVRHIAEEGDAIVAEGGEVAAEVPKKNKYKAPRSVSVPITSETLDYKGSFFTIGDVVSMVDDEGEVYYAQIRGLLQDQYFSKSAVITWLIPTAFSPRNRFDAKTFIIGPEEDTPRDLAELRFECHSPSPYYRNTDPSLPKVVNHKEVKLGFALTSKGYRVVTVPAEEFDTDGE